MNLFEKVKYELEEHNINFKIEKTIFNDRQIIVDNDLIFSECVSEKMAMLRYNDICIYFDGFKITPNKEIHLLVRGDDAIIIERFIVTEKQKSGEM